MNDELIVQYDAGKFTVLAPFSTIVANSVQHPWNIVDVWTDAQLAAIGVWRVGPATPPHGQVVTAYHFAFETFDGRQRVVQIIDATEDAPSAPPSFEDVYITAQRANARIDAGIEAGLDLLVPTDPEARVTEARQRMHNDSINPVDQQIEDLQTQIDALQEALYGTLRAQQGPTPRRTTKRKKA